MFVPVLQDGVGGRGTGAAPGVESRRGGKSSAHACGELPCWGGPLAGRGGRRRVLFGTAWSRRWRGCVGGSSAQQRCPGTGWPVTAWPQQEGEHGLRADAEHWGREASRGRWVPVLGGIWRVAIADLAGRRMAVPCGALGTGACRESRGCAGCLCKYCKRWARGWSGRRGPSRAVHPATSWEQGHRRLFHPRGQGWPVQLRAGTRSEL